MERRWTPEQQDAIEARDGTVLVSAAAGSGKTAVLVERFIRRITDPVAPVDADRMLVVTFTRAAAGEMRERILAALNARIAAEPGNAALRRQKLRTAGKFLPPDAQARRRTGYQPLRRDGTRAG